MWQTLWRTFGCSLQPGSGTTCCCNLRASLLMSRNKNNNNCWCSISSNTCCNVLICIDCAPVYVSWGQAKATPCKINLDLLLPSSTTPPSLQEPYSGSSYLRQLTSLAICGENGKFLFDYLLHLVNLPVPGDKNCNKLFSPSTWTTHRSSNNIKSRASAKISLNSLDLNESRPSFLPPYVQWWAALETHSRYLPFSQKFICGLAGKPIS